MSQLHTIRANSQLAKALLKQRKMFSALNMQKLSLLISIYFELNVNLVFFYCNAISMRDLTFCS